MRNLTRRMRNLIRGMVFAMIVAMGWGVAYYLTREKPYRVTSISEIADSMSEFYSAFHGQNMREGTYTLFPSEDDRIALFMKFENIEYIEINQKNRWILPELTVQFTIQRRVRVNFIGSYEVGGMRVPIRYFSEVLNNNVDVWTFVHIVNLFPDVIDVQTAKALRKLDLTRPQLLEGVVREKPGVWFAPSSLNAALVCMPTLRNKVRAQNMLIASELGASDFEDMERELKTCPSNTLIEAAAMHSLLKRGSDNPREGPAIEVIFKVDRISGIRIGERPIK